MWIVLPLFAVLFAGCASDPESCTDGDSTCASGQVGASVPAMTLEQLMDPESCRGCHENVVQEWEGSMHAFASHDPVFIAMNKRGQRETNGALGDFCVQCHAPVAVALGLTTDGLNLEELPDAVRGVTCYACHNVQEVAGSHNNPLVLAMDGVMRGGIADPVDNVAHASAYSPLMDRNHPDSASVCGACHDIVTPAGLHIERTYLEWQESVYAAGSELQQQTCGSCHMGGSKGLAADYPGSPVRTIHSHTMPGIDQATIDWPDKERQAAEIQASLDISVYSAMCVFDGGDGTGRVLLQLENIGAGHSFPSGAAQDRRVWVELRAFDEAGSQVYQSGVVGEGEAVVDVEAADPGMWRIGDRGFKADGSPAHMFWDIASIQSDLLPAPGPQSANSAFGESVHLSREYKIPSGVPDRVEVVVKMRSLGRDFVQDLIDSGDLEPSYLEKINTFELGLSRLEWKAELGQICVPDDQLD